MIDDLRKEMDLPAGTLETNLFIPTAVVCSKVDLVEQHGADNLIYGALSGAAKADIDDTEICFKTAQGTLPDIDSVLKLHFDQKTAMIFNKESGERLI